MARTMTVLLTALILLPGTLQAQTPTGQGFSDLLKKNDRVIVIGSDGTKTRGRLSDVTADSIAIHEVRGPVRSFAKADILELRKPVRDRLLNGPIAGLALGFLGLFALCEMTDDGGFFTGTRFCLAAAGTVGGIGGALIGLVADYFHTGTVTIYKAANRSESRFRVTPVVTPSRAGMQVSIRLGR